ncbi:HD domain-containing protein [Candidatus Falkowbacteria bacterium]|jgi:putative hydrolases of HD superfamily|nr:HD domain-containing protein [Candidatus Falkowbacteria bacterium]MBT7007539.1 HD domain-containing protein [Candidatus Falkowbacteria bacterium]
MKTKHQHTSALCPQTENVIIQLFFEFAQLKSIFRQGWLKRGVPEEKCESDADHIFMVALLGYIISLEYRPDLDSLKVMQLGLFHELGEIYAGDITPSDGVSLEEKQRREQEAVEKVFEKLPNPERYIAIWREYDYMESPEAQFVKQIDKLETVLMADLYKRLHFGGMDDFFPYIKQKLSSTELTTVFNELMRVQPKDK